MFLIYTVFREILVEKMDRPGWLAFDAVLHQPLRVHHQELLYTHYSLVNHPHCHLCQCLFAFLLLDHGNFLKFHSDLMGLKIVSIVLTTSVKHNLLTKYLDKRFNEG